jgi:hypothetical protein
MRTVQGVIGAFAVSAALVVPPALAQYRAEDIVVPPGYEVTKIAETNRIVDPYRLTFDASGNLIAGSYNYMIYSIAPDGEVSVIGKTRKYDINPLEVEPIPGANGYVIRAQRVDSAGNPRVVKYTPPDTYETLFESPMINAIGFDRLGNFYAVVRGGLVPESDPPRYFNLVKRYDQNFQFVEMTWRVEWFVSDFCFDGQNNLYMLVPGSRGSFDGGVIIKVLAGGDGIPGPYDPVEYLAPYGLTEARDIAVDDDGQFVLIDEYLHTNTDGYSSYDVFMLTMIRSAGTIWRDIGPDLLSPRGLALKKDDGLYVSEMDRSVVSKVVNTGTIQKVDFTVDRGLSSAGAIAFDADGRLYTHSFRQLRLFRLGPDGGFSQVGPGTGYSQQIASDGAFFYLGCDPTITGAERRILRIEPFSGATQVVASGDQNVKGFRSLAFDSFGRLILNTEIDAAQNLYGADIIDLTTGTPSPYVTGLHNKGRNIQFDNAQNFYFVEGIGTGIKKVHLLPEYATPPDLSSEPLFYDLNPGGAPFPPTVYFFCVNPLLQEVFIPQMDSGTILHGDIDGKVEPFARGFLLPTQITFDSYGALYVSDAGNGIFRIVYRGWTIPAIIELKEVLLSEVRQSALAEGLKMSLAQKLVNTDAYLEAGDVASAMSLLGAFRNEVAAQRAKKIPADLADVWIKKADDLVKALGEIQ